jgi:hypothetical protein
LLQQDRSSESKVDQAIAPSLGVTQRYRLGTLIMTALNCHRCEL